MLHMLVEDAFDELLTSWREHDRRQRLPGATSVHRDTLDAIVHLSWAHRSSDADPAGAGEVFSCPCGEPVTMRTHK